MYKFGDMVRMKSYQGFYAAGAIARTEAQILFPKDNKKDKEKRDQYVEENWRKIHPQILFTMSQWEDRQVYNNSPDKTPELKDKLIPPFTPFKEFLEK